MVTGLQVKNVDLQTEQVTDLLDLNPSLLKQYVSFDYLKPAVPSTGRRQRQQFNFSNLTQIKLLMVLGETQIPRKIITAISRTMEEITIEPNRNPFSLEFLSDSPIEGFKSDEVFLRVEHFTTFLNIGLRIVPSTTKQGKGIKESYLHRHFETQKNQLKFIQTTQLSKKDLERLDHCDFDSTYEVPMNKIHSEVKQKLRSKGLLP